MSESAADLLQALQQKAATGLQSIKQAVHEYETWLADATVQARQRLRSLPSAQLGGNSAPTISATVNKARHAFWQFPDVNSLQRMLFAIFTRGSLQEVLEPRRPAPAGKRRRKASPVLATVAEEEDAEQVQEGEGKLQPDIRRSLSTWLIICLVFQTVGRRVCWSPIPAVQAYSKLSPRLVRNSLQSKSQQGVSRPGRPRQRLQLCLPQQRPQSAGRAPKPKLQRGRAVEHPARPPLM